jgi:hypothetical protein
MITETALENGAYVIDVFYVDDDIYAFIEGGHIIHSAKPVAQQGHKNLPPRAYAKICDGIQYYVGIEVFCIKVLVQYNHIINVEPHILDGIFYRYRFCNLVTNILQDATDFFSGSGV